MRTAFECLEQRRLLAADLSISMVDNLPEFVVPGDKLTFQAVVQNTGDEAFKGLVSVQFLAPSLDADDPMAVVATVQTKMSLKAGASKVVKAKWVANDLPALGRFDVSAVMTLPDGGDANPENDASTLEGAYDLRLVFGTLGSRKNVTLSTVDEDGTLVKFSMRGGGYGEFLPGEVEGEAVLRLSETNGASKFAISTKGGDKMTYVNLDIQVDGSLKSIDAKTTNFTGSLSVLGSLDALNALDVTDFDMGVGSFGRAMTFKARDVTNLRMTTVAPIGAMTVASWSWVEDLESDLPPEELSRVTAPSLAKLTSKNDFSAIVVLTGEGAPRATLGTAKIGGGFSGEMIVNGNVSTFTTGLMGSGLLLASGTIARFSCGWAEEATVWASTIAKVEVGTVINLEVGAGATFSAGQIEALSGGDSSGVSWGAGVIGDIRVRGDAVRARFAAGVNPVNGVLLDVDDLAAGNGTIGRISVGGAADDVAFAAVNMPETVKFGRTAIFTPEDDRFLFLEPVS